MVAQPTGFSTKLPIERGPVSNSIAAAAQPPSCSSMQAAQHHFQADGIHCLLGQLVGRHGVARTKSVPLSHLGTVLTEGAGFVVFAIAGVGIEPHRANAVSIVPRPFPGRTANPAFHTLFETWIAA